MRISQQMSPDGQLGLGLALVDDPDPTDQVVDTGADHVPVYVEQAAARGLDDKVLDAQTQDGQVGFVVANQT